LVYVIVPPDSIVVGFSFDSRKPVDHIQMLHGTEAMVSFGTAASAGVIIITLKKPPAREH
jgi:hypothetical protein